MLWNKTQEFRLLALLVPQHQLLEHPATTSSRGFDCHTITDKKKVFPAARQMLERQKTHPSSRAQLSPGGKADAGSPHPWWGLLVGIPPAEEPFFPFPRSSESCPASAPALCSPGRWQWHSWAVSELSLSCPLPGAPLGRCSRGSQRVRVEDREGLVQPHLLFAASPSPAFGRLQVTASQGSLKVLCSHFLPLPSSPWVALIFQPFFLPKQIPVLRAAWWVKHT